MKRNELKQSLTRVRLNIIAMNFLIIDVIHLNLRKLIVKVILIAVILIMKLIKLTNSMFTFQIWVRIRMKKLKKFSMVKM